MAHAVLCGCRSVDDDVVDGLRSALLDTQAGEWFVLVGCRAQRTVSEDHIAQTIVPFTASTHTGHAQTRLVACIIVWFLCLSHRVCPCMCRLAPSTSRLPCAPLTHSQHHHDGLATDPIIQNDCKRMLDAVCAPARTDFFCSDVKCTSTLMHAIHIHQCVH
jgi:hypothetical protein